MTRRPNHNPEEDVPENGTIADVSESVAPVKKPARRRLRKKIQTEALSETAPAEHPATPSRWTRWLNQLRPERAFDLERQLIVSLRESKIPTLRQLRHAGRIFTKRERTILVSCLGVIAISLVWISIGTARAIVVSQPVNGGSYTEAIVGQPQFINPVYASSSAVDTDLTRLVYAGLLRYNDDLSLAPDLAQSYVASNDNKIFTVTLRDNLTWQDGEPLTVDDVLFTFQGITQSDVGSPLAPNFSGVVVEKVDDHTVRFTLANSYPAFGNLLTTGILPKHIWTAIPFNQWRSSDENIRPVGAGPWQFDSVSRDRDGTVQQYSLLRAPARDGIPTPYLNQLIFKFFPDVTSADDALNSHAAQGLVISSLADHHGTALSHLVTYDLPQPAITSVFFNVNTPSPAQDVKVRQALSAAIDKTELLKATLPDGAVAANGPFPPGTIQPDVAAPATDDPQVLLASAGWTRVGALWKNKNGDTLSLNLSVIDRQPDRDVGAFIVQAWQKIGVDARIDLITPAEPTHIQASLLRPRSYQALLYTITYGATVDPYPFWHSSQRIDPGLNFSLYANKEVDDEIESARRAVDPAVRNQALTRAAQLIEQDVPAIFLYSPLRHYIVSDDIHGITVGRLAIPADRFNSLSSWYTKVREALR